MWEEQINNRWGNSELTSQPRNFVTQSVSQTDAHVFRAGYGVGGPAKTFSQENIYLSRVFKDLHLHQEPTGLKLRSTDREGKVLRDGQTHRWFWSENRIWRVEGNYDTSVSMEELTLARAAYALKHAEWIFVWTSWASLATSSHRNQVIINLIGHSQYARREMQLTDHVSVNIIRNCWWFTYYANCKKQYWWNL